MSAPPSFHQPRQTGRRADARVRLGIPCTLVLLSGNLVGQLEDVSCTGARIMLSPPAAIGSEGVMVVNGIEAFGEVVWVRAGRVGFRFDERLPLDIVVRLRHFADSFNEHERRRRERLAQEFVTGRRSS
ncbi:PilZ domain-containing protein [Novosphingobium sp. KCTC 2891]|uniref:PilZ domain-containing protein n=1 Tax=Novosphingobium sp. KCTC 2891 TaxID=2989730 RepID=UPI00222327CF|nr:PilZ domain-containing protein [Novosphingobium sp. KCTC 2891]MCW1381200.1 PilZ domain-containing protein [Novosphingobium sp. KCTC 2891]